MFRIPPQRALAQNHQAVDGDAGGQRTVPRLRDVVAGIVGAVAGHVDVPERMLVVRVVQLFDEAGSLEGVVATVKDFAQEISPGNCQIITESQAMLDLLEFVRRVATSGVMSILIEGENGTGKDLLARALHHQSVRQSRPFVAINCAAIPATLLESELFGYDKGAFTDARRQKAGLFELADKGTLFLDEIADLPLPLQPKLLRVLEDQCFRRVGGLRDIAIDVRIIAATNKDSPESSERRSLAAGPLLSIDCYSTHRAAAERRPRDILPLARFFVEHYNRKFKRKIDGIWAGAESLLLLYQSPGDVRELRNAIERAMILEDTREIRPFSLPVAVCPANGLFSVEQLCLAEQERRLIVQALGKTAGSRPKSAVLLGITPHRIAVQDEEAQPVLTVPAGFIV